MGTCDGHPGNSHQHVSPRQHGPLDSPDVSDHLQGSQQLGRGPGPPQCSCTAAQNPWTYAPGDQSGGLASLLEGLKGHTFQF